MIGAAREAAEGSSDLSILFNPRAAILAGARERSIWTKSIVDNLSRFGFPGAVHFVNRKGQTVFGRSAASSCTGVGEQADVAFVLAPANAVEDAIEDVGRAGVGFAIVLTAGFGENGEGGRVLQERISNIAKAGGVRLLGPNCLGFVNYSKSVPLWAMPMRRPRCVGGLAMVSHSGLAIVETMSVKYSRDGQPACGVVVARIPTGQRLMARARDDDEDALHALSEVPASPIGRSGRVWPGADGRLLWRFQ